MSEPFQAKANRGNPLVRRVGIYAAVLFFGLLLGFIPMWFKGRECSGSLAKSERQLSLVQMQNAIQGRSLDERAHVDYAWQVAHGHLPVAATEFTAEFPELGQKSYFQHVSNHPPLYYAIAGPVLRAANATGHPASGLYALRPCATLPASRRR